MKKYFCLILFLFSAITFAQKFEFDFVREYVTKFSDYDKTRTTYSNSKNPNYLFAIFNNGRNTTGEIYDLENRKIHEFKVTTRKENNKLFHVFKYKKSSKLKREYYKINKNYRFEFIVLKKDAIYKTVLLKEYCNYEGLNIATVNELKIKESESNHFPNFRFAVLHPMETMKELDIFENGLVVESVQIRNGERVYPTKLVNSESINLELIVE